MRHLLVPAGAVLCVLTGCGQGLPATGQSAGSAYSGPLVVTRDQATHPRAGAAGDVVKCTTWGTGGSADGEVYAEGATAATAEGALEVAAGEWLVDGPTDGLRVARREEDRVLWVLEVAGVVKQAVVVRDGPATEGAGGDGWYVESWARCDAAELPRSWTDRIGLLVWEDAATGEPVPTTELEARRGPEHCDWQETTFLQLGDALFLGRPTPDLAERHLDEPWRPRVEVPDGAVDTGYERAGRRLWLSPDRQRAFVGTQDDAELWPRARPEPGCD